MYEYWTDLEFHLPKGFRNGAGRPPPQRKIRSEGRTRFVGVRTSLCQRQVLAMENKYKVPWERYYCNSRVRVNACDRCRMNWERHVGFHLKIRVWLFEYRSVFEISDFGRAPCQPTQGTGCFLQAIELTDNDKTWLLKSNRLIITRKGKKKKNPKTAFSHIYSRTFPKDDDGERRTDIIWATDSGFAIVREHKNNILSCCRNIINGGDKSIWDPTPRRWRSRNVGFTA